MIYALYDFDRSGADAARSLDEKLTRFADERGVEVHFQLLGLTFDQVVDWNLPNHDRRRRAGRAGYVPSAPAKGGSLMASIA